MGLLQAGSRYCTGILIAPDMVLTAAHCLYRRGQPIEADEFIFMPGHGTPQGQKIPVLSVIKLGAVTLQPVLKPKDVPLDWALLQLSRAVPDINPLRPAHLTPEQILAKISEGADMFSAGYGSGENSYLHRHENCRLLQIGQIITTNCEITEGDSGGPILLIEPDGTPDLLAIISGFGLDPKHHTPVAAGVVLNGLPL